MNRPIAILPLSIIFLLILFFIFRNRLSVLAARIFYFRSQRLANRGLFMPALKCLHKAMQQDPTESQYPLGIAYIYLSLRDMAAALKYAGLAGELGGSNYFVHMLKGDLYAQEGNFEMALTSYKKAAALNADRGYSQSKVGEMLYRMDRTTEALAAFDEALQKNPDDIYLQNYKGFLLYELGHYGEAIENFDRVLAREPQNLYALFFKGKTLQDAGNLLEAREIFAGLVNLNNDYTPYAHLALGSIYQRLEEFSGSEIQFRKYIDLMPDDPKGYMELGFLYLDTGKWEEAIDLLQISVNMEPSGEGFMGIGKCYMHLFQPEEALKYFKQAIYHNPIDPGPYQEIGYCLDTLARHREASAYYEKARELQNRVN